MLQTLFDEIRATHVPVLSYFAERKTKDTNIPQIKASSFFVTHFSEEII
jgi:hypothetical protein